MAAESTVQAREVRWITRVAPCLGTERLASGSGLSGRCLARCSRCGPSSPAGTWRGRWPPRPNSTSGSRTSRCSPRCSPAARSRWRWRAGPASRPGVVKDVYAVWELPIVFLLPGMYALIVPAIRLTLTQWRVRRAPAYKRVYTVAAIGIAYGCARLVYMGALPANVDPRAYLWSHTSMWLVAAGLGAVTQWADQPGADPGRLQAGEPGGQHQERAVLQGDAAQRRDRAVRRPARRGGHDDQRRHADHRASAHHAAAALLPARAAAERGAGRREDGAAQRGDLGARGGGGGRPRRPHVVAAGRGAARPGPVQADQRHPRPPSRR